MDGSTWQSCSAVQDRWSVFYWIWPSPVQSGPNKKKIRSGLVRHGIVSWDPLGSIQRGKLWGSMESYSAPEASGLVQSGRFGSGFRSGPARPGRDSGPVRSSPGPYLSRSGPVQSGPSRRKVRTVPVRSRPREKKFGPVRVWNISENGSKCVWMDLDGVLWSNLDRSKWIWMDRDGSRWIGSHYP